MLFNVVQTDAVMRPNAWQVVSVLDWWDYNRTLLALDPDPVCANTLDLVSKSHAGILYIYIYIY